ncbi:MAG: universal stress protein [Bacteroidia bacterium]|nr:universal stress protein [Bacteroidia bacterium]
MNTKENVILVAMDFSESALNALSMSCEFAKIHEAKLVLLHVIEGGGWLGKNGNSKEKRDAAEQKLAEMIEKCKAKGRKVETVIKEGNIFKEIIHAADEMDAELIAMGTYGHGKNENGKMLGTLGSKIVRSANCPVITVKGLEEAPELKKILIPVAKEFGIREIRQMLEDFKGKYEDKIELISVISPDLKPEDDEYKSWSSFLRKQHKALTDIGFQHIEIKLIPSSDISGAISKYAEAHENDIDLIMMETHGRSGLDRMLSGSVTEAVINVTHLPVLSIRPEREEKGGNFGPSGY